MKKMKDWLDAYAHKIEEGETGEKFRLFYRLLSRKNEQINLTRIAGERECYIKHFLDSVAGEKYFPPNASVAEVGSGGGFPSVPLMLLRPDLKFTLIESVGKKCAFLEEVIRELDLPARVINARAEEAAREETVPMNGMRKAIARNMQNSHMTSPTVTFNLGIDMTEIKRLREQLKSENVKVSYTDILVKVVARALTEFPALNCSVEDNRIIYKHYVNMGVAVALDNGLLVPNIRDADKKSLTEISAEVRELAAAAREGRLPMDALTGGTFTITNLGMYGIESFSPIINQPEVAILGVNTMQDKVVVVDGEICVRPIMNLSLTADHRVIDGSVAAQFLQRVKALMEKPALLLA